MSTPTPYLNDLKMSTFSYPSMSNIRTNVPIDGICSDEVDAARVSTASPSLRVLTEANSQLGAPFWGLPALGGSCLT